MSQALRVAGYHFRKTFTRRWGGYLSVVLLVGLIGGIAMTSIAAARRTQSSYPTFLASTNPSDMNLSVYNAVSGGPTSSLTAKIAHLSNVKRVRTLDSPTFVPLASDGAPRLDTLGNVSIGGSVDGLLLYQDRTTVVQGREADPNRSDEMTMDATAAHILGVHVGQIVPMGFYTNAETNLPGFGTPSVTPRFRIDIKLVGIFVANNAVVEDDVDRAYGTVLLSPALIRRAISVSPMSVSPVVYGLQLEHGGRDVTSVEKDLVHLAPRGLTYQFHITSRVVTEVELAVKPESVALGGFGAIAAAICLVLGIQAISRQLSWGDEDRRTMRSLGAGPAATVADGLIGILGSVVLGSLLAVGVTVGLSPLSPLGPVRPVYPDRGIAFDWTVLGIGLSVLVSVLGAAAVVLAYRTAPHRVGRNYRVAPHGSSVVHGVESAGMPIAGVVGMRLALEPERGRSAVPMRSALLGTILAVALVMATLTFASSLATLVSHPALYGWNWSYALDASNDVPPQALKLLAHDSDVSAWTGVNYNTADIDGESVPFIFSNPGAEVTPPILSGHGLTANDQIILGSATLAELHKHVGDTVFVSYGSSEDAPFYIPSTREAIVGTATFPAVGYSSFVADHTSMGIGALVSEGILPAAFQRANTYPDPNLNGPELVFVRLRGGVSLEAGHADMDRIVNVADRVFAADPNAGSDNNVFVLGVQRPAQIVNYRSIGSTPVILAVGLAAGAVVALALTLAASVRRRRRDLALLKALGCTPRQLAVMVAWQATVSAVLGIAVGIPLGIVLGRELWTLFARNLDAVPDPTVPLLSVVLVAAGALVLANLAAAIPGHSAARTPTALILRSD